MVFPYIGKYIFSLFVAGLLLAASVLADTPLTIRGQWEQGGLLFGQVEPDSRVRVDGRDVRVSPSGDFVFGLSRSADKEVVLLVISGNGASKELKYSVKQRSYDIQRVEGVEEKHVTPSKAFSARIARESKLVESARALNDSRMDFLQDFQWPLKGPITGVYGSQRVYNGVPKSPHYGIDIAAPTGARVKAPAAGLVTLAENDLFFSGGTLILDHGYGLSSTFIHLSKLLVKVGQNIQQGQEIAEVGATGRATGPHLDWRMNWLDVRVDPGLLMKNIEMD